MSLVTAHDCKDETALSLPSGNATSSLVSAKDCKDETALSLPSSNATPSWNAAHRQTCLVQNSLSASPQQVWKQIKGVELPLLKHVHLFGNVQANGQAVAEHYTTMEQEKNETAENNDDACNTNQNSTTSPSLARRVAQSISKVWNTVVMGDEFHEQGEWEPEEHDDARLEGNEEDYVEWNSPVLNLHLAAACIQRLLQECNQEELTVMSIGKENENATHSFMSWCHEVGRNSLDDCAVLLQHISHHETLILAYALQALKKAQVLETRNVIVFGQEKELQSTNKVEVAVALFEIQQAMDAAEERIQLNSLNATEAAMAALQAKHCNRNKLALQQMKRRQMYLSEIEKSRAHVLKLTSVETALQTSQTQQQVLASLQSTTVALQSVRQPIVGEVDDVMLDLQEQMEQLEVVEQAMASLTLSQVNDDDDEDLLRELQQMENDGDFLETTETATVMSNAAVKDGQDNVSAAAVTSIAAMSSNANKSTEKEKDATSLAPKPAVAES